MYSTRALTKEALFCLTLFHVSRHWSRTWILFKQFYISIVMAFPICHHCHRNKGLMRTVDYWLKSKRQKKKATDFFVTDLYVIFIYLRIRPRQRIIITIARSLLKHNKLTFTCWVVTCHLHTQLLKNSGQRSTLIERKRGTSSSIRLPTGEALMFS